jgi:serine protease Do
MTRLRAILMAVALLGSQMALSAPVAAQGAPDSFADLAERLTPAVVSITTESFMPSMGEDGLPEFPEGSPFEDLFRQFFERYGENAPQERMPVALGSGFIIDPDGYVVTNNHVIEQADAIIVRLDNGRELEATVVGIDPKTDIALLKVEADEPLPYVNFGDSSVVRVGDWVLAIGNPFGFGNSVTAGIISARQRDIQSGPYDDYLQTDAPINRGNSGGPLFNMDGEVVGVNTAIYSPSGGSVGIGFAVPSILVQRVVGQLRDFGRTKRGWLGVRIQTVTPEIAEGFNLPDSSGALVASVTPDGPAEKAGLESGDVIVRFNGNPIDEMRELPRVVADTDVGQTVEVVILRNGQEMTFDVELGELEAFEDQLAADGGDSGGASGATKAPGDVLGMNLVPMNDELAQQYGLDGQSEGLVVIEVLPGSPAAQADIAAGDIVLQVGQAPVSTADDVSGEVDAARERGARTVVILVERDGDAEFRAVNVGE